MNLRIGIVLLMLAGLTKAQVAMTFLPSKTYTATMYPETPDNAVIAFRNNGTTKISVTYTNAAWSFPSGWNVGVCDTYNCMGGINPGAWQLDSLAPGAGNEFYIQLSVDPGTVMGSGWLKVYIWQNNFPNDVDTLIWTIRSNGVGVAEITANTKIKLFPNPVKDVLYIDNSIEENSLAYITDALGRRVLTATLSNTSKFINVSLLEEGVYTLTIESKGKQFYKRIVKE